MLLPIALGVALLAVLAVAIVQTVRAQNAAASHRVEANQAAAALAAQTRSSADERQVQAMILASMEEGVLLFDAQGARVFANEAISRHLGDAPANADLLLPIALRDAVRRAGYIGATVRTEAETGAPTRWLRASAQPVGTDGSVLLVVRDITEARRIDAIRRDFVANASHELKTPVASIRAAAETLRDGAIDDRDAAHRFTEQMERDADRLGRIVSDLLDLSRLETGSERLDRTALDAIAEDEVARRTEQAAAAGISLAVQVDGVPAIRGSSRDLALMVGNLIDNAIRYTSSGGAVSVEVRAERDAVVLRVTDTGAGIPQRDLPRIFERFYRVDQARSRETGGTGLGLSIVRHVSENHGGEVTVTSELGQGSTFEVRLPTSAEPAGDQ
jgi:two-component system, OmpR family, phosphate regulon sensor histidine kinase PhoR